MQELIENEVKFIIFAHHLDVLNAVEESVRKKNVKYMRIDGGVNHEERHARVKRFQEDPATKVKITTIFRSLGVEDLKNFYFLFTEIINLNINYNIYHFYLTQTDCNFIYHSCRNRFDFDSNFKYIVRRSNSYQCIY